MIYVAVTHYVSTVPVPRATRTPISGRLSIDTGGAGGAEPDAVITAVAAAIGGLYAG